MIFTIESRSTVPIFEQIVDQVGKYIALGIFKPNDQLPPVRTLAKDLGINPNTVSKAYLECEIQQLIYSIPGKGSFVATSTKGVSFLKEKLQKEFTDSYTKLIEVGETKESILKLVEEIHHDTTD